MSDDQEVKLALESSSPTVLVEAPAGCGKTHAASRLAIAKSETLESGQKLLILAHTNGAKEEFTRRTRGVASQVQISTIDSLCLSLVSPYASALGLPTPVEEHIGSGGSVGFNTLSEKANELLQRAPTIARLWGRKHPWIICDEHQDASADQHAVIRQIGTRGQSKIRYFGDPMQAIFDGALNWDTMAAECEIQVKLSEPHRWKDNKRLGEWILCAREALKTGGKLNLDNLPAPVSLFECPYTSGNAYRQSDSRTLVAPISDLLSDSTNQSAIVLTRNKYESLTAESAAHKRGMKVNEGSDHERAYLILKEASALEGDARSICELLIEQLSACAVGITKALTTSLKNKLTDERIKQATGKNAPLTAALDEVYSNPNLKGVYRACTHFMAMDILGLRIQNPLAFRLLSTMSKTDHADARSELRERVVARQAAAPRMNRSISTIHKAKGLDFDRVLIAYCTERFFADDEISRKLLYVALSRAKNSITLHLPKTGTTPLLGSR